MIKRIHSLLFLCRDLDLTTQFYERLGFDVVKADDAVRVQIGDFKLAFMDEQKVAIRNDAGIKPKGAGFYMYFEVDDVDDFFQILKRKNVKTSSEPKNWPWGKREFAVKDPDGYKLIFFSPVK